MSEKICIGCSIANGELSNKGLIIYQSKNFIITQDPEVPIKGFLIIQSKKHFNSMLSFNKEERQELSELVYKARQAMKELNICEEVTVVQEEKSRHFHIWLFPWYDWMKEKVGKGVKYLRDINEYAESNATENDKKEVFDTIERLKKYFLNIEL